VGAVVIEHFHLFSRVLASKQKKNIFYIFMYEYDVNEEGRAVFIPMKLIFHMRYIFTNKCAIALLQAPSPI
jgi:hypothetical protein